MFSTDYATGGSQGSQEKLCRPLSRIQNVGSAGSTICLAFPGNAVKNLEKKVPEWGPEKKVPESAGLVGGSGSSFGPDLIFKPGQNHQKWPELDPESTVWAETWSRSMPGPFPSLWDGSNPLQGAVPGKKSGFLVSPGNHRWRSLWKTHDINENLPYGGAYFVSVLLKL